MHTAGPFRKFVRWANRKLFPRVYLCGGINGLKDAECINWREFAKNSLAVQTVDPMRRDYRGIEGANYQTIVHGDLKDILRSGVLLVNACRPSWGTAMEVPLAWLMGKEVVAFVGPAPISPWLKYFADTIRYAFGDAVHYVNGRFR